MFAPYIGYVKLRFILISLKVRKNIFCYASFYFIARLFCTL
uniref:Uncharacterized protein n=1 Tax=Bartonella schoenbuchensis (strain DSM 13525 / NCTC 13165 / R1) TaxID=687861 RepID=E6YYE3_BARSR|nr:hypothetical protein B11C_20231 [Bartonella schoenbuchensis R1]